MRLVTHADVDEGGSPLDWASVEESGGSQPAVPGIAPPSAPEGDALHVEAQHELELDDGRRVLLLDDRGWTTSGPSPLVMGVEDIEFTARTVVGPDEPFDDRTHEDMARDHWESLARDAADQGVEITADRLRRLPHDVVLGPRVRALVDAVG